MDAKASKQLSERHAVAHTRIDGSKLLLEAEAILETGCFANRKGEETEFGLTTRTHSSPPQSNVVPVSQGLIQGLIWTGVLV